MGCGESVHLVLPVFGGCAGTAEANSTTITMTQTVKLVRLSICPCGFTVLKDEIGLGTVYQIDLSRKENCVLLCGGCGKEHKVRAVFTLARDPRGRSDYLPMALFYETLLDL